MKKLFYLVIILSIAFSYSVSLSEYPLSENEKNYVGSWSMYADNGKGTIYSFVVTFLDNYNVVQNSMIFKDGDLSSDNKASGEWSGFTSNTIIFSLAGKGMYGMIKDDGYLYMYFSDDMTLCGVYSKCEDMTSALGW